MIFAQHVHRLFRLGRLGESRKAAQIAEYDGDLAAVAVEQALMAVGGGDQLRYLRREETLELADALDLAELGLDPLLQRAVPVLQLLGLHLELGGLLAHDGVGGFQLAALVVDFGEQPRIAHRQHRLVRKGLHQADQVGRKFAVCLAQHHQRAEHALLVHQRHHQHRVEAGGNRGLAQRMLGAGVEIFHRDRLTVGGGLAEQAALLVDRAVAAFGVLVDADRLRQVEAALVGVIRCRSTPHRHG